ncbi:MAG TPA: RNA 3'-terminal phosphate cyclase, partial [Anaerolineae bacterium]|nr:RNA 3'-terminal phosphate cyclase [Anaerolineae bacterium]
MLIIDGSQGEGGGQVLRTCLSLSVLTGRPFRLENIRAGRSKPGLRPQHLTGVWAAGALCDAEMEGDYYDSQQLTFKPQTKVAGGSYRFDVRKAAPTGRSAGAVTLILQTVLWPLLWAGERSEIVLRGGTHVPFSPSYHYMAEVARPAWGKMGVGVEVELKEWGFMGAGKGEMVAQIEPTAGLEGV